VVVEAAGKAGFQEELGDIAIGVEDSGDQLSLGSDAEKGHLNLALQKPRLDELVCLVPEGFAKLLLALGIDPFRGRGPNSRNSNDRLQMFLGRQKQAEY
jgi:hypothetical protein